MTRARISAHFVVEEFDCHDGTRVPTSAIPGLKLWALVWGEPMRDRFGPVRVTSGYRAPSYNRSVGGAPSSFHIYSAHHSERVAGRTVQPVAGDVVPARGTVDQWQRWARTVLGSAAWPLGIRSGAAVGYQRQGFIHLDTGPRRTWVG